MTKYMLLKSSCIALSAALVLSACGGGSSSSSTSSKTKTAYLIDAAVSGVKYVNSDGSTGFTANDGSFTYVEGKTEFFVGKVKIGEISSSTSDSKFYVQDVVGVERTNINDPKVLKVATFLQSIDADPSTKEIEVSDNFNDFNDVDVDLREDSSNVNQILTTKSFTVKSEDDVKNHLKTELQANNIVADTIAPTIKTTNLTSQVEVSANLNITFSEKMNVNSFTSNNIILKEKIAGTIIGTSPTFNNTNNTLIIDPNVSLDNKKEYILTLKKDISDINGNKLANATVYNFTTALELDEVKPTVLMLNKTSNIKLNENLKLKFSENIKESTLAGNITLRDNGNNNLELESLNFDTNTNILTINPKNNLLAANTYTIKVKNGLSDLAGNSLNTVTNDEKVFTFTTLSVGQAAAPTISSTSLDSSSTKLAINSNLTVTFSKEIMENSINANSVKIRKDGTNFDITTKLTLNGNTLTINPVSDLTKGANYTLSITNDITDTYGQKLDYSADKTYSFTTEQEVDNTKPELISSESSINNNDKNIEIDANFSFTFNEDMKSDTITTNGVVLEDSSGTSVATTVTYANKVITINPNANLNYASLYTLKLLSTITDLAGNTFDGSSGLAGLQNHELKFITKANPSDTTAPALVGSNNLGTKNKDDKIELTFNEELKEITSSNKNDYLIIPSGYTFDKYENKKITIKPLGNSYDTNYTITLRSTISDLANNNLASDITITFKTQKEADTSAPEIVSTIPVDNVENVNLDANLSIVFNEEILASTVNATNILLVKEDTPSTNLITNSEISYDNTNKKITINPSSNLELNTNYDLIIKKDGIKDLANNAFEGSYGNDYKVDFKTRLTTPIASCSAGYSEYNNKCYKVVDTKEKFTAAKTSCESDSAKLIDPKVLFYSGGWNSSLVGQFASNLNLDIEKVYWTYDESASQSYVIKKGFFSGWTEPNSSENKENAHEYVCVK